MILLLYKNNFFPKINYMKKIFFPFLFFMALSPICTNQIYQSYIQVYGEGPKGQFNAGMDIINYSQEETVQLAKAEIIEFLSGMIYGYTFIYRVENKLDHTDGYFELMPIYKINPSDKNIELNQINNNDFILSILAIYQLLDEQKNYIMGFQSSLAKVSSGEAKAPVFKNWESRLNVYKDALRNTVLNEARNSLKARPLFIRGRLLLKESPKINIISGEWVVKVEAHIIIKEIEYQDVY